MLFKALQVNPICSPGWEPLLSLTSREFRQISHFQVKLLFSAAPWWPCCSHTVRFLAQADFPEWRQDSQNNEESNAVAQSEHRCSPRTHPTVSGLLHCPCAEQDSLNKGLSPRFLKTAWCAWGQGGSRKAGGGASETAEPEAGGWVPVSVPAGAERVRREGITQGVDVSVFQDNDALYKSPWCEP